MPTPESTAAHIILTDIFNEARKSKTLPTGQYWLGAERRLVGGDNQWTWIASGEPVLWASWRSNHLTQSENFVSTYNDNSWRDQDGNEVNNLYCIQVICFLGAFLPMTVKNVIRTFC